LFLIKILQLYLIKSGEFGLIFKKTAILPKTIQN
jgi:hypothetical protein